MSSFSNISSLSLGNTFGAWYNKTNEIIDQLNLLDVASVTGGDGISVLERSAPYTGGFTIEFSGNVTKNTTFAGNVSIAGTLTYGALNSQMVSTEINLPYESGVTVGNIVYVTSSGFAQKALADDECTAEVVGVVKGICGSVATVATTGQISGASLAQLLTGITGATFLPGTVYFLSAGTSGAGTTLEPTITDYISKPIVLGITSDTALILPYRGFIANSGYSLGTSTTTGTGGFSGPYVRTLNASNAKLVDDSTGEFFTSGNLFAVNMFTANGADMTRDIIMQGPEVDSRPDPIADYTLVYNRHRVRTSTEGEYITGSLFTTVDNSQIFEIFATSGSTLDVWRLKTIKCSVTVPPRYPISFVLNRTINRLSCTSYINNENRFSLGYGDSSPSFKIALGSKLIQVQRHEGALPSITDTADLTQEITNYTILNAIERTPYFVYGESIDGVTTANISASSVSVVTPDSSGVYPIIYGTNQYTDTGSYYQQYKLALSKRVYFWEVNPVIVGSSNTANAENAISKAIDALILSQDIDMAVAGSGATMDTSVIGWNATYGAVPETLSMRILDFPNGGYFSFTTWDTSPHVSTFFFEFVKFNPVTQTEDQNRTIIPIRINRTVVEQKITGKTVSY